MEKFEQLQIGKKYLFKQTQWNGLTNYFDGELIDLAIPMFPPKKGWDMSFKFMKLKLDNKQTKWVEIDSLIALAEYYEDDTGCIWQTPKMKDNMEKNKKDREGK
jgi:hypothetical protein